MRSPDSILVLPFVRFSPNRLRRYAPDQQGIKPKIMAPRTRTTGAAGRSPARPPPSRRRLETDRPVRDYLTSRQDGAIGSYAEHLARREGGSTAVMTSETHGRFKRWFWRPSRALRAASGGPPVQQRRDGHLGAGLTPYPEPPGIERISRRRTAPHPPWRGHGPGG